MRNLNTVLVEGNLTRDVDLKYTSTGTAVGKISIATNKAYKKNDEWAEEVSYFDIEVWGKLAETCNSSIHKGSKIRAIGVLKQDRWKDSDGKTNSRIKIVANEIAFDSKRSGDGMSGGNFQPSGNRSESFSDDIPF